MKPTHAPSTALLLAASLAALAGCTKDEVYRTVKGSLYNLGMEYDCIYGDVGTDVHAHARRCSPKAMGGNREEYRDYARKREEALKDDAPHDVTFSGPAEPDETGTPDAGARDQPGMP